MKMNIDMIDPTVSFGGKPSHEHWRVIDIPVGPQEVGRLLRYLADATAQPDGISIKRMALEVGRLTLVVETGDVERAHDGIVYALAETEAA